MTRKGWPVKQSEVKRQITDIQKLCSIRIVYLQNLIIYGIMYNVSAL